MFRINLRCDSVQGDHVRCTLFMNGAKCGDLVFRIGEYQIFGAALGLGVELTHGQAVLEPENDVFRKWAEERAAKEDKE